MTLCTVAIPVYNRREFVGRAIESALAQSVEGLEVLVVDNCSTDGSWDVIRSYKDSRLRPARNDTNVAMFGNFNRCLELARGDYLRFLCSDDCLTTDCLAAELRLMQANSSVVLLNTRGRRVDPRGRLLGHCAMQLPTGLYPNEEGIYAALWSLAHYAMNPFNYPSGILLRRDAALRAGRFDTGMVMAGDVDFFLRVLLHGDLAVYDTVGCEVTIHPQQASSLLEGDTRCLGELCEIAAKHADLVRRHGSYERLQQQFAAYALGLAFKHWRLRQRGASRAYLELARRQHTTRWQAVVAISRLLCLRQLARFTGAARAPVSPLTYAASCTEPHIPRSAHRPRQSAVDVI